MFPINETVRKNVQANLDLSRDLTGQMMEWQSTVALSTQKSLNSLFDGYRTALDANQKAARAMQQTLVTHLTPDEA